MADLQMPAFFSSDQTVPDAPVGTGYRQPESIDRVRYLRVIWYFGGTLLHLFWWDIILRHTLGRRFVDRSAHRRWQRLTRRFRGLAVDLGGVLIKLGQFLSVRVDLLPQVVTAELAGLQDEVPPVALDDIQAIIEAEYGQPLDRVFRWFAPQPEAAASLAQVHRARLLIPPRKRYSADRVCGIGDDVVVKVQRPNIETIVETDLRAIRTATRWLKSYRAISRRVNLDQLYDEFSRTTRAELDFVAEGQHAERFARDFGDDPQVRIPHVYAAMSTRRVLIMEDVADIKITDYAAIEAAGIDRRDVARCLFDTYLKQVFIHNFVHADPHPGNLFVQPLARIPDQPPPKTGPGQIARTPLRKRYSASSTPRPFRLVFVDFGMVATVPERVRKHLRDFLVGFVQRDSARMIQAYQGAGLLLPGADLERLEQIESEILERYSGLTMRQAQQLVMSEWQGMAREYRDVLYEMPFQIPSDLLFVGRAVAILFGMATALDPDFDPWEAIEPFAKRVAADAVGRDWRGMVDELEKTTRLVLSLPVQVERFLNQANRGQLSVRSLWSPDVMRTVRRVEAAVNRLAWAIIFAALLLAAVAVYVTQGEGLVTYILLAGAVVAVLVMIAR